MSRRLLAAIAMALVLAGCSSAASPSSEPSSTRATVSASLDASPSPSAAESPQDAALAAYLAYTDAIVTAMREGDAQVPALTETTTGQALRNARARVAANAEDGVVVTGQLEPSATTAQVQVTDGGGRAEITDCVLNGLAQVNADDPDRVISEATGWRQPIHASVTRTDDGWRVTQVRVPRRDGSGPVQPPTSEAPLLRAPAQGQAPPSCVPAEIGAAAVEGYRAFHDAYNAALGIGSNGPADPNADALTETAVDPQLTAAREYLSTLASKGQAVRGEPDARDPWPVAMLDFDDTVYVYDCVTLADNAVVEDGSSEVVARNDTGALRLDAAELTRVGGEWKVVSVSVLEEGLEQCSSPE